MQMKIKNSMILSARISGKLYEHLWHLAKHKKVSLSEYVENALVKYSDYKG